MVNTGQIEVRDFLTNNLSYCKGNWDIYIAFFDFGYSLLNSKGNIIYITPDKWISKPFGDALRCGLINNFKMITEVGRKVFLNAKVDSIITQICKTTKPQLEINFYKNSKLQKKALVEKKSMDYPFSFDWLFSDYVSEIEAINLFPKKLSDYAECESACATSDAYELKELLINGSKESSNLFKVINTGTIDKYVSKWGVKEMTYLKDKYLFPVINREAFLSKFPNSYGKKAVIPKIIIKGLTLLDGCLDLEGNIIPGKSTLVIKASEGNIEKLYFILALINSSSAIFYIKERYRGSSYNQGINFNKDMLNNLPIPELTDKEIEMLTKKVKNILFAIEQNKDYSIIQEDINKFFSQKYLIDNIV